MRSTPFALRSALFPNLLKTALAVVFTFAALSAQTSGRWVIQNASREWTTLWFTWQGPVPWGGLLRHSMAPQQELAFVDHGPVTITLASDRQAFRKPDGSTTTAMHLGHPMGNDSGIYQIVDMPPKKKPKPPEPEWVGPHLKNLKAGRSWSGRADLGIFGDKHDKTVIQLMETDSLSNIQNHDLLGTWAWDAKLGRITSGTKRPNYVRRPAAKDPPSWVRLVLQGSGAHYEVWLEVERVKDADNGNKRARLYLRKVVCHDANDGFLNGKTDEIRIWVLPPRNSHSPRRKR